MATFNGSVVEVRRGVFHGTESVSNPATPNASGYTAVVAGNVQDGNGTNKKFQFELRFDQGAEFSSLSLLEYGDQVTIEVTS